MPLRCIQVRPQPAIAFCWVRCVPSRQPAVQATSPPRLSPVASHVDRDAAVAFLCTAQSCSFALRICRLAHSGTSAAIGKHSLSPTRNKKSSFTFFAELAPVSVLPHACTMTIHGT